MTDTKYTCCETPMELRGGESRGMAKCNICGGWYEWQEKFDFEHAASLTIPVVSGHDVIIEHRPNEQRFGDWRRCKTDEYTP